MSETDKLKGKPLSALVLRLREYIVTWISSFKSTQNPERGNHTGFDIVAPNHVDANAEKKVVVTVPPELDPGTFIAEIFAAAMPQLRRDKGAFTPALPEIKSLMATTVLQLKYHGDDAAMLALKKQVMAILDPIGLQPTNQPELFITAESLYLSEGLHGFAKAAQFLDGLVITHDATVMLAFFSSLNLYTDPQLIVNWLLDGNER